MSKLVSKWTRPDIVPRYLLITDVEKNPQVISTGDFQRVFLGKHGGQLVALKTFYKTCYAGVRGFLFPTHPQHLSVCEGPNRRKRLLYRSSHLAIALAQSIYTSFFGNISREGGTIPCIAIHDKWNIICLEKESCGACHQNQ